MGTKTKMAKHLFEKRLKVTKKRKILRRQSHIGHTRTLDSSKTKRNKKKLVPLGVKKNIVFKNLSIK
ncbi:MAG: hypothetical protein ACPLXL_00245 [Minisyncoccia bacterium]